MKLKAVFEIHGLSNVLTGARKAEGIAEPGDLYEVDNATAKVHQKEGYGIDPNDPDLQRTDERIGGPQIIEGELDDETPSLKDIATPAAKPAAKKSGGKKKAAAQVEETPAAPAEDASGEDDLEDLGLDDDSDSVE